MNKIKKYFEEVSYLRGIQSLLYWDMETMMPSGAINDRAQRLSYVQSKIHELITHKKLDKFIQELSHKKTKQEKRLFEELNWDFQLNKRLPVKHVEEVVRVSTLATHVWADARKRNDFKSFLPHLQKLIDLKKKESSYFNYARPYDYLIKLHDKEFDSQRINKIFSELKNGLLDLVEDVKIDGRFVKIKDPKGPFSIDEQKKLSEMVARLFGLPENNSRLDTSTHPFSINISPRDQRITTRYDLDHLDSFSSTMHEVGHALYELNLPSQWEGTPLAEAASMSIHESQSRFWENIIGRSKEFCVYLLPHMKKHFPKSFAKTNEEDLFLMMNKSVPGLIRVESCELYYNFHVIIRFEIEELIFNQGLKAKDIPKIWNEKYRDYLGLIPSTESQGVLQDSHWAGGAFGYFPTYTLGNLISGSLYQKLKKQEPNLSRQIANGKFEKPLKVLKSKVHQHGRMINSKDLVGDLSSKDYLKYLREKFGV